MEDNNNKVRDLTLKEGLEEYGAMKQGELRGPPITQDVSKILSTSRELY